jgi:hypothetical protein
MIDQYLNLHPNLRFFHIGHDEVYYFLTNPACDDLKRMTGIKSHLDLFGYHLNIIANYIKKKSPDLILLIWHDVIQNLDLILLQKYNLINLINPVLWSYREDMSVEGFVLGSQADIFGQYQSLWGATAFKGATHEIATISDVKHYYESKRTIEKDFCLSIGFSFRSSLMDKTITFLYSNKMEEFRWNDFNGLVTL